MEQFDPNEIKRLIEERFNWGPSDEWTNFHFKELRKAIEEATGDNLSVETLKRIFGKRKSCDKKLPTTGIYKIGSDEIC